MPVTDPLLAHLAPLLDGQYQFERELGRGGMGVVYLARELRLDRLVAVKVLPPHLASQPTIRERFLREARTAGQLSHPNIVPIYRAEEVGGFAYFAMAYIEGENLAERVRDRGPLPAAEVVRVLRESAWALAYAHARGVVHRDIKAANVLIERGTGRAVVTDFGIARDAAAASLTGSGEVVGTVHYMSPEQANGHPLDGRSDLYSLGVTGFYALSGRLPFEGENPAAVLVAVASRDAPSLASLAPQVPQALVEVIDRCLQKAPEGRYPTGERLAEALTQALERAARETPAAASDTVIPTGQAQAIWLRAAQLQAEAASRLEQRSRQASGLTDLTTQLPSGGYRLRDVEAAAQEVGIAPEYVALALAERPPGSNPPAELSGSWKDRAMTTLLGTSERSLSASRVIRAPARAVLEAIGRVFPARPYLMTFRDTVGGHPLDGGVLVFRVPKMMQAGGAAVLEAYTSFTYRMYQLELFQLNVTIRPVQGSAGPACEVTVYGDLRPGLRKNLIVDQFIAGGLGAGGAAAGAAVGIGALQLGALAVLTGLGGTLVLGGAGLLGYRWGYRRALHKSREEIESLLQSLETNLRSQSVFGAPPPAPSPPPTNLLHGGG